MTVLIPEAAGVIGSTAEGAAAGETAAVGGGTTGKQVVGKVRQGAPKPKTTAAPAKPKGSARPTESKKQGGGSKKRGKGTFGGFTGAKITGKGGGNAHKLVIAEFILVLILIGMAPILTRKPNGGHLYVANDFVRLSAACLLFFVLALLSNSPRSSRFAAAFGGLVLLGVTYNATNGLKALADIFTNAGTNKGQITTASAGTATVHTASYTPNDLLGDPSSAVTGPAGSWQTTTTTTQGTGSGGVSASNGGSSSGGGGGLMQV